MTIELYKQYDAIVTSYELISIHFFFSNCLSLVMLLMYQILGC